MAENLNEVESLKKLDDYFKLYENNKRRVEASVAGYIKNLIKKDNEEIVNEKYKLEQEYERDLRNEILRLEANGISLNEKQRLALAKDRLKKEEMDSKKIQQAYWKEQSKQAQKQQKQEERKLDSQLKMAKLLSTTDEEGNAKKPERMKALGEVVKEGLREQLDNLSKTLSAVASKIGNAVNNAMSTYANYQTGINARLQGTDKTFKSMENKMSKVAYSPLFKTETLYENLNEMIKEGIAFNVEQRAFLQTIKDNIATTFDANNIALRRLIRLQQADSTASRLGMEASLTNYMNKVVQNTEYLTTTFDNVQEALLEASSLMSMGDANEFEYNVQKWLGNLGGLGLSESTSSSLAQALGYLGSGNIEQLSSSSMQNLLVMAAARSGLSYGQLLTEGLDSTTTNELLSSLVQYAQKMYDDSKDNKVVMSQLSNVFGLTVSDLKAISNLDLGSLNDIYEKTLSLNDMYDELKDQAKAMRGRMSISTLLDNAFSNYTFATGADLASNPITYATWKITDLIQQSTGGINIPAGYVLGTGVDMNTTIENLIKLGLVGFSTLKNIPNIANGIYSLGVGSSLLKMMGISANATTVERGIKYNAPGPINPFDVSSSSIVTSGSDNTYEQGAMAGVEQENAKVQEAAKSSEDITRKALGNSLGDKLDNIYSRLNDTYDIIKNYYDRIPSLNTFGG